MANTTNQTPYILDTVANNIVTGTIWIAKIRWVGATTLGHECQIKDGAGKIIWDSFALGASYVETDTYPMPHHLVCQGDATTGISVTILASGKLYIYLA